MLERDIERKLVKRCKDKGWLCEKFVSPANRSVPDRIVITPDDIVFVELKATGKQPTRNQLLDHDKRRALNKKVYVINSIEQIEEFITEMEGLSC